MAKPRLIPLDRAILVFTNEYEPPDFGINPKEKLEQIRNLDHSWGRGEFAAMLGLGAATIGAQWIEQYGRFVLLCEKIRSGRLVAYGLRTKPTVGDAPEQIPAYLFDKPIYSFTRKAIEKSGYRYELIEVSKPSTTRKPKVGLLDFISPPRGVGRPSKDEEIDAAIKSLIKSGFDFSKEPRTVSRAAIRKRAQELGSNIEFGFSDPVLQKHIYRRFGTRK